MKRVYVLCEGSTERTFIREVLQPEYATLHLIPVLPGHSSAPARHGGNIRYARIRPELLNLLKMDPAGFCTTMLDFYALGQGFPGRDSSKGKSPLDRGCMIEQAMEQDITAAMGHGFDNSRFRAYLSMHEFEALLFSNPVRLADALGRPEAAGTLLSIRAEFTTPEDINDDVLTAPSKRLQQVFRRYDKVVGGNVAALSVGVEAMRRECPHFSQWLGWFDNLAH